MRVTFVLTLVALTAACDRGPKTILPQDFGELCFVAKEGDSIVYRFEASAPLAFNVHYHIGDDMFYPVPEHDIAAEKGQYTAPMDQDYCLKWSNNSDSSITVDAVVEGVKAIDFR